MCQKRVVNLFLHTEGEKDIILSVLHICLRRKNTSPSVSTTRSPIVCGSRQDETQVLINPQFRSQRPENRKPSSLPQMARFWWRIWLFFHTEAPAPILASFQSMLDLLQKMTEWHASYEPDETGHSASVLVWTIGGCKLPKTSDVEIVWLTVKKKKAQLTFTKSKVG